MELLTMPETAKRLGVSVPTVKAWALRMNDPLPHFVVGKGTGKRVVRKVLWSEVPAWMERNATGGTA